MASLAAAPMGSLGPPATTRRHLRYYDALFLLSVVYGHDAGRLLEVGPASPAFAEFITWVPSRSLVAPYFTSYRHSGAASDAAAVVLDGVYNGGVGSGVGLDGGGGSGNGSSSAPVGGPMKVHKADFLRWEAPHRYDLVLCSQVLEHISAKDGSAGRFVQKLLRIGRTVIISVPYKWNDEDWYVEDWYVVVHVYRQRYSESKLPRTTVI